METKNKMKTCVICNSLYGEDYEQDHYANAYHVKEDHDRNLVVSSFEMLRNWFYVPSHQVHLLERAGVRVRTVKHAQGRDVVTFLTTALPFVLVNMCVQSLVMSLPQNSGEGRLDWCRVPYDYEIRISVISELAESQSLSIEYTEKLNRPELAFDHEAFDRSLYYRLEDFLWVTENERLGHQSLTDHNERGCYPHVTKPYKDVRHHENMGYLLALWAFKLGDATHTITKHQIAELYRQYFGVLIVPSREYKVFPEWFDKCLDYWVDGNALTISADGKTLSLHCDRFNCVTKNNTPRSLHFNSIYYNPKLFEQEPPAKSLIDLRMRADFVVPSLKLHEDCMTAEYKAELAQRKRDERRLKKITAHRIAKL